MGLPDRSPDRDAGHSAGLLRGWLMGQQFRRRSMREWGDKMREQERLRRQTRNELLAQRERMLAKVKAMYRRNPDPLLLKRISEFEKNTAWPHEPHSPMTQALLDAADLNKRYSYEAAGDPGRIKMEEKPKQQNRLVAFYARLVGRKAGNGTESRSDRGDDHGVLPEGGAAERGLPAGGLPADAELDAGAGDGVRGGRP